MKNPCSTFCTPFTVNCGPFVDQIHKPVLFVTEKMLRWLLLLSTCSQIIYWQFARVGRFIDPIELVGSRRIFSMIWQHLVGAGAGKDDHDHRLRMALSAGGRGGGQTVSEISRDLLPTSTYLRCPQVFSIIQDGLT